MTISPFSASTAFTALAAEGVDTGLSVWLTHPYRAAR